MRCRLLGKRWWKRPLFLLMNCLVNLVDMISDLVTFVYLWDFNQPHWALLTLFWMFAPFLLHLAIYLVKVCNKMFVAAGWSGWGTKHSKEAKFKEVLIHLPFVTPIRNFGIFVKLCNLGYPYHKDEHSEEVEALQTDVARVSLYENFCEAGPQSVTQCVIFLCTGHISIVQIVSIFLSLVTLTWGASRAYFIQRVKDEADPDPNFGMVILRIFPFMLVTVANSLVMWVLIGGFLGGFTFVTLVANFCLVLLLTAPCNARCCTNLGLFVVIFVSFSVLIPLAIIVRIFHDSWLIVMILGLYLTMILVFVGFGHSISVQPVSIKFSVQSSIWSLWVPCVIGTHFHLYIYSVISTLSLKLCELAISFTLAFFGHQWPFYSLIWCVDSEDIPGDTGLLSACSFSDPQLPRCFTTDNDNLHQKFRVCEEKEEFVHLCILFGITLSNLLAIFSSWELHRRSDYEFLYQATKRLLLVFPSEPVVHRSLLFSLVRSDNSRDLDEVLQGKTNLTEEVNRPNAEGDTPLHVACQNTSTRCVHLVGHSTMWIPQDISQSMITDQVRIGSNPSRGEGDQWFCFSSMTCPK